MRRRYKIFTVVFMLALIILGALFWHYLKPSSQPKPITVSDLSKYASNRYWIIEAKALNDIAESSQALTTLKNDTLFVPGMAVNTITKAAQSLHIVRTQSFTSEAAIAKAIDSHAIAPETKAILYDNEDWPLTPQQEQANPLKYYELASAIVQGAGYVFIASPVSKINPDIDVLISPYVNVLDIQSQFDQASSRAYSAHVLPIAKGARAKNPKLIILSGLSTNPTNGTPTLNQLLNDAHSVGSEVQGFWLNIPSRGSACPNCHQSNPALAIEFLQQL